MPIGCGGSRLARTTGRWGEEEDPIVSRIARLREHTVTHSPVEIVARVLNYVGVRPIATAWGPDAIRAAQRQRNLDAFLKLAVTYENHCATQHEAATLTGFLFCSSTPRLRSSIASRW